MTNDNLSLQTLLDRAEISDVINRYGLAVDARDWALFRTCFTDDIEVDLSSVAPGHVFQGKADQFVSRTRETIEGLDATQHIITNHAHEIHGDTAKCTSYLHAQHVAKNDFGDSHHVLAGYYNYDMVRTDDGWKIKKYRLTITWGTGNSAVLSVALERKKEKLN